MKISSEAVRQALYRCDNCDYQEQRAPILLKGRWSSRCRLQKCHVPCDGPVCKQFSMHSARKSFCEHRSGSTPTKEVL